MVGAAGIEPATSMLKASCSPSELYPHCKEPLAKFTTYPKAIISAMFSCGELWSRFERRSQAHFVDPVATGEAVPPQRKATLCILAHPTGVEPVFPD